MSDIYRFADLELDTSRFQVRRAGQALPVQPQVFDVLHYLVANHHRIVTKDELLETVWSGRFISETTLSSRIKAVRKLLGDTGKEQVLLQTVRNRGFRYVGDVETELTAARRISTAAPPQRGLPSTGIAALPFEVVGEDADQTYIGEGIAADIISLLSRHQWLKVISRGSSFAFKGREATPQQVGAALGVGYLLSGRIRRSDDRLRIDAELADCTSGRHLWDKVYDIEKTDVLLVQERIAQQLAAAIEPRLEQFEQQRIGGKPVADLDAWDCCHKAFWHLYRFTPEDLESARRWFGKALEFDANLARAHGGLAYSCVQLAFYGSPSRRNDALQSALASARQAVALDDLDAFNHFVLGRALCLMLKFKEAQAELEAAIAANPSFAQAHFALAFCFTVWDRPAESIPLYEKAFRLSPQDPHIWTFHHMRSMAHFRLEQMDDAEHYLRAAARQQNATYWPFATLCALLGDLGRLDEAGAIADRLLRMKPGYSLEFARQDFFFTRAKEFVDRYVEGLARGGVPAHSDGRCAVAK